MESQINAALHQAGRKRAATCSSIATATQCGAPRVRSDQPEQPSGLVRSSKCLSAARGARRAAHRSEVAADKAGWASWGEKHWGYSRETGIPNANVPLCLPSAEPEGVDWSVGGRGSWDLGRRGFEKLWGMALFPKGYRRDFSP